METPAVCRFGFLCLFCFMLTVVAAKADDYNLPVQPPGLQLVTPLTNKAIQVTVAEHRCSVTYTINNSTKDDLYYTMMLSAPRYSWRGMSENNPDRSYADLQIRNNNITVAYTQKAEAFLGSKNITSLLAKYGIEPNIIADGALLQAAMAENRSIFSELIEKYIVNKNSSLPVWSVKNTYSWLQAFPSDKQQIIEYSYEPLWGTVLVGNPDNTYYLVEGFDWNNVERYYEEQPRSSLPAVGQHSFSSNYLVKWLNFPLADIAGAGAVEKVSIKVFADEAPQKQPLIFISYGDLQTMSFTKAELHCENITGTEIVNVVIVKPIQ